MTQYDSNPGLAARSIARSASSAILHRLIIDHIGFVLVRVLIVAVVLIGIAKLFGIEWLVGQWLRVLIIAGAVSAVLGASIAIYRRPDISQGAGVLDAQLGLQSQIRSSLELSGDTNARSDAPGFVELLNDHAGGLAAELDVKRAMDPIGSTNWLISLGLVVLTIVMGVWIPGINDGVKPREPVVPSQAIAQIEQIEDTFETNNELAAQDQSPKVQDAIKDLEALKEELAQGVDDPKQANTRTAAKLEELADAIDEQTKEEQEYANERSQRIDQAQNMPGNRPESGEGDAPSAWEPKVEEFADALKDQDFDRAGEAYQELQEQIKGMSDEDRERVAEQLEQLADAIEPDSLNEPRSDDDIESMPTDTTPDKELAESIRDEAEDIRSDRSAPDESLEEPSSADDSSSIDSQTDEDQADADQPTDSDSEPTGSEPTDTTQEEPSQTGKQGNQEKRGQKPSGQEQQSKQADENGQTQQSDEQGAEQQRSDGDQKQDDQSQGEQAQDGREQDGRKQDEQSQEEQKQDGQSQGKPSDGDQPKNQSTEDGKSAQSDQNQQDGAKPAQQGEAGDQTDQENRQQNRRERGEGAADENQQGSEQRSVDEAIEEMQRRRDQMNEQENRADDLREQAMRLIQPGDSESENLNQRGRGMPPSVDQPQDDRGAGDRPRNEILQDRSDQPPSEQEFIPVDGAKPEGTKDSEPVGKWYAPEGDRLNPEQSSNAAQRLREASDQAQRAVEQQQVPRKYRRVVREAFERVKKRADSIDSGTGTGSGVAPQGQDAVPKTKKQTETNAPVKETKSDS